MYALSKEFGTLPYPGGLSDQSVKVVEAFKIIMQVMREYEKEQSDLQKTKAGVFNG